ncbi:HlyD family type I secretion periplasmic adaptor subunit [Sneathiella glossodoripedis]|uniref:HlyD family type I secretion periplasmic adaptor subunit n=1 Tax=Sneathiella glossodoripedis TaxID=418853 RepID=UPI0004728761|nr:HlyD family type I secretion periplasmic adaptor subunit [Sneathiella glossodoripedis]
MGKSLKFLAIDQDKYRAVSKKLEKGKPETQRLGQSIMLEENGPSSLLRIAILFSFVGLLAFIVWAQNAVIDEVAVASGEVIPSGTVQTLQHIDGGTISNIAIEEGEIVKQNQVLIQLDPTDTVAELKQLRTQELIWRLKSRRLQAFINDTPLDASGIDPRFIDQINEQQELLKIQRLDLENQQSVVKTQIDQRKSELQVLQSQIEILKEQIKPLEEQMKIREGLYKNKTLSRFDFLDSQRQYLQEKGNLDELISKQQSSLQAISEAENRLQELNSRIRREALDEMALANSEALKLAEEIERLEGALGRLNITSPVDGIVQGMDVNSVGTVIKPGSPILSIVPIDQELIVEARIRPEDIGFLQIGQDATVKFTTYNYSRYGSVSGKLIHISATTFEDEQGENFYKGKIKLDQPYVGNDPSMNLILPGMTAVADIHSGKKSLMDYLLKPIHTTITQAFRER